MIKKISLTFTAALLLSANFLFAQTDTTSADATKDKRPVKDPFESGYLINNQTVKIPTSNTLEWVIQHRFGKLNSKKFDLLGMYAPSNIRMGLNYSIMDWLQAGIGSTKNGKLQDINLKLSILRQTRSGSMPVSLTYFHITAIDAKEKELFPKFTNRFSYFHQLIISRKFNNMFSLQVAPSFSHFNIVDTLVEHDNIGLSVNGRVKISAQSSIIFEYDHPFSAQDKTVIDPKPNIGLGLEVATSAHAFQIFVGSFDAILNQHNILYNANDFTKKDVLLGFNITRLWNF